MAEKLTFEQLLSQVGKADVGELQAKREKLERRRAELEEKLGEVQSQIREIDVELNAPLRDAIKAAKLLGIEVPEQYQLKANGNGGRSSGKYRWECPGQVPFKAEVSRAMWRLSRGSGGSAGKNGEGVLSAPEFWSLAGISEAEVRLGEKYTVTLPNGREVVFQRVE